MEHIFKAVVIGYPNFFVAGMDEKQQMISTTELFFTEVDARKWVADQKKRYNIKTSKVSKLRKNEIRNLRSGDTFLEISLTVPGNIYNDFQPQSKSFTVRRWSSEESLWVHAAPTASIKDWLN